MITSFTGEFRFLSNFWPARVVLDGLTYPTVEHAYQAAKTLSLAERSTIQRCGSPGDAKRMGTRVYLRDDWESVKLNVMEDLLRQKFGHADLRQKLIATGAQPLVEGNTWGDTFWGMCRDKGQNHLGKLLMQIRDELNGR